MVQILVNAIKVLLTLLVFAVLVKSVWKRLNSISKALSVVLCFFAVFIAYSVSNIFVQYRTVTITGLNQKSEDAKECNVVLVGFSVDGQQIGIPEEEQGSWTYIDDSRYCWFPAGDGRRADNATDNVSFLIPVAGQTEVMFECNKWKGKVSISIDSKELVVDTYYGGEGSSVKEVGIPKPDTLQMVKAVGVPSAAFAVSMFLLVFFSLILLALGKRVLQAVFRRYGNLDAVKKVQRYRFLFEELVKRDFVKKYKRTILGMAWSVLSPLLTLFVMRMVFTQFFGRTTSHYTIYLFCGNIVFSYFNESTTQGMTSLVGNASIFTKVNVPKYLFLLSKNVQTLINFGLTLGVLYVFCLMDKISITWRFILLIYPVMSLVLFNIGAGLILSALFVFFKDIQYLWSIFTMLLMYMSAIFYSIDGYPQSAQQLFLLNPVYLHIAYFRDIIINSSIPTLRNHILMLIDVCIVLLVGCWMYKKYNTKFLYYV